MTTIVLSLEESFDLDSSAPDALLQFDARMAARGVHLELARVRDTVLDLIKAAGARDLASRCAYSFDDAVAAASRREPSP